MTAPAESARIEHPSPRPPAAARRIPDFFILGHHKCGTTALYEMLRRHPQICMSQIKEPRYFASDLHPRFQPPRGHVLPSTLEDYLTLFSPTAATRRVGEATPSYLFSRVAASRIAQLQPAARCIAILREPASFLRSLHLQLLRSHVETERDLGRALALEADRCAGRRVPRRSHVPQLLRYAEHVRYVAQLERYRAVFPAEQLLVLIYEDFRADNRRTLRRVLDFLGLDGELPLEPVQVKRTERAMRSQRLDDALRSLTQSSTPLARGARGAIKTVTPRRLRRAAFRTARREAVYSPVPDPDERLMATLRRRFAPEVRALSEYLNRDLVALWGYDGLV